MHAWEGHRMYKNVLNTFDNQYSCHKLFLQYTLWKSLSLCKEGIGLHSSHALGAHFPRVKVIWRSFHFKEYEGNIHVESIAKLHELTFIFKLKSSKYYMIQAL